MWKVPYTNFKKQFNENKDELISIFSRIMESGSFILREDVNTFEKDISQYLGVKHAVVVNSGSDALILSVKAHGISTGDEVITVAHTYIMTLGAIHAAGAMPVLVDIKDDFNMNEDLVESLITEKTKAIMPVHINGRMCDMSKIRSIADKYNLIIIEDAAQGIGSKFNNKSPGTFNSTGCFSSHPMKNLNCAGDGGFITTDSDSFADELRVMRNHGQKNKYEYVNYGLSSRLDTLQAAILNHRLKSFPKNILRRKEIAAIYQKELKDSPLILPFFETKDNNVFDDVFSSFVVQTDYQQELHDYLRDQGIEVFIHLGPKSISEMNHLSFKKPSPLTKTEELSKKILSLPMYPELDNEQIIKVCEEVKNFFSKVQ